MVISPDEYNKLSALLFHTHHQTYWEDIPFWMEMAARQGGPILELGCGTGRISVPIAQEGYQVFGLDKDYSMLEVLKKNPLLNTVRQLDVIQADAAAFHLAIQFALVIMPCNTYSTFNEKERREVLNQVNAHMASGGAFVFSTPNPELLKDLSLHRDSEIDEVIIHPVTGYPVQVVNSWERYSNIFELNWHYDHLLPDGTVDRVTFQVNQHIVNYKKHSAEFADAGLSLSCIYGDYDFSDYRSGSPYLILMGTMI